MKLQHLLLAFIGLFIISHTVFCSGPDGYANNNPEETEEIPVDSFVKLSFIFAGDIMGHGRQIKAAWDEDSQRHDFSHNYIYLKDIFDSIDIVVGNLEVPLVDAPPYRGYPLFRSPQILANNLKDAGFNLLLTANNHSNDAGQSAFENTLNVISELNLYQTGTFKSQEHRDSIYPLIINKNDFKIAFLNYSYGTNAIPDNYPNITNLIDTAQIRKDFNKAQESFPDLIIACMHWGNEYQLIESAVQARQAAFLANLGVDLIIGSHPHVIQPIKWVYNNEGDSILCVYSLGNLVSNQRFPNTDGGLLFEIHYRKNIFTDEVSITDFFHHIIWVNRTDACNEHSHGKYYIIPVREYENEMLGDFVLKDKYLKEMQNFVSNMRKHLEKNAVSTEKPVEVEEDEELDEK